MSSVDFRPGWRSQTLHTVIACCEQGGAQNIHDQLKPGIQLLGSFAISGKEDASIVDRRMSICCPTGKSDVDE